MSESTTTTAPAAPAAAPAPSSDSGPAIGPAPASQPALSVSEAGRLLSQQRRQAAGKDAASPEAAERKPSPQDMVSGAAQKAAEAAAPAPAPATPAQPLTALDRALGVPGGEPGEAAPPSTDTGQGIEIEGQRYSTAQLREAVLKASDYTVKTQELAQQRQAIAAQQEAFATVLPFLQPELQRLAQVVGNAPPMPDVALAQTDPTRYVQERAAYDAAMAEQQRLGHITALQQQAQTRAMEQAVAQGNEALAKEFPFWNDPTERSAAQQQIVTYALSEKAGFSRDELRGLTDPRQLKMLMKAMAYDKWVQGAKTTAPAQRLAAPVRGAPPPPAPTERIAVSEQAFDARPNIRNAAALLAARRANGTSR
jgi:hypothetical protein